MFSYVYPAVVAAVSIYMLVFWLVSLVLRDVSIVDIGWDLGFVVVAWVARIVGDGDRGRSLVQASFVTIWGLRLGLYLLFRNWGKLEDYRYAAMRRRVGPCIPT